MPLQDADELRRILGYDRIAVVGASTTHEKPAHIVPAYLKRHGYELYPVNPTADEIFGEQAYDSVREIPAAIDIVEIFRPSEEVPAIVEQSLSHESLKAIWTQPGIRNDEAAKTAEAAGVDVVQDRCMKSEHGRLIRHPME